MSSATAPYPYFNGITYNPSFFSSSSTSLTQGQANLLYLRKTTADTATALETFTGGIATIGITNTGKITSTNDVSTSGGSFLGNTLTTNATSDILNICTTARSADINIGTGTNTLANAINIGSKSGSGASITTVNINTAGSGTGLTTIGGNSATTIGGVLTVSGDATCSSKLAVSGVSTFTANCINNGNVVLNGTNITAGASFLASAYNILTTVTGTIGIGSSTSTTTISGPTTIGNDLTMGSNKTIFTTSGQQMRLGYANTQITGASSSSFGPFFKSFGPASISGTTYDITLTGSQDALFTPSLVDGVGGLLTIVMKNTASPSKCATYIYNVMKRTGVTGINSIFSISLQAGGWTTTNPTLGSAGGSDNLRITFNAADVSGTTVSWLFMGSI